MQAEQRTEGHIFLTIKGTHICVCVSVSGLNISRTGHYIKLNLAGVLVMMTQGRAVSGVQNSRLRLLQGVVRTRQVKK